MIDCTKEQHERLQELIGHQLAEDRLVNRPDLGKGVESGACWDLGAYMSELGKMDAKPETKQRNKYALNPKNKDGLDSKWQHAAKHAANTLVDDGSGNGTMVRACVKASNTLVDDGSGKGTKVRACHKQASCITCNVARRTRGSDKCNPCAVAVMVAFLST